MAPSSSPSKSKNLGRQSAVEHALASRPIVLHVSVRATKNRGRDDDDVGAHFWSFRLLDPGSLSESKRSSPLLDASFGQSEKFERNQRILSLARSPHFKVGTLFHGKEIQNRPAQKLHRVSLFYFFSSCRIETFSHRASKRDASDPRSPTVGSFASLM